MTTLLNVPDYEVNGGVHTMTSNDLYLQVKFHSQDPKLKAEREGMPGNANVQIKVKFPNPPSNSGGEENDFAIVKIINDSDSAFKMTLPTGTEVRADLRGNTEGYRVRVWGIES